jgi:hypothetical protein
MQTQPIIIPSQTGSEFKKLEYLSIMKQLQATILLENRHRTTFKVALMLQVLMLLDSNKLNKITLAQIREVC